MFDWIRRTFFQSHERQQFFDLVDGLNAQAGGGAPTPCTRFVGRLPIPSRRLAIADVADMMGGIEVAGIEVDEFGILASTLEYPNGQTTVTGLTLRFESAPQEITARSIGKIGIDAGKLIVADKVALKESRTKVGKNRIGVLGPEEKLLRDLSKRFGLQTIRVNPARVEVVGPVSEELERRIVEYLKSIPKYAKFPFIYFYVQSNNTFDRANFHAKAFDFLPIGNEPTPLMFLCQTGRGDGGYGIVGGYAGEKLCAVSIDFMDNLAGGE